jgi:hypothetical protein
VDYYDLVMLLLCVAGVLVLAIVNVAWLEHRDRRGDVDDEPDLDWEHE